MTVTKSNYQTTLDEKGAITSLVGYGKELVAQRLPLFRFRFGRGPEATHFTSDEADSIVLTQEDDRVILQYRYAQPAVHIKGPETQPADLLFTVTIRFLKRMTFHMTLENETNICVEWIDFPQIALPNDLVQTGGSGRLLMDMNEGLLIEDLGAKEAFYPYACKDPEYPSMGLNCVFPAVVQSQFLAYYDDTAGLYMAAEDKARRIKGIDFAPIGDTAIQPRFRLYPGVSGVCRFYALPYPMVLDVFQGDWYTAAEKYRQWFETHLPKGLMRVEDNPTLPAWYTDSPLVVTYPVQGTHDMDEARPNRLFPYNNALPHLDAIAEKTGSRLMALLMHWEGTAPWAPPYVWPPLGGEAMLREFSDELHRRHFLLGVYCSGISYTVHSNINDYNMEDTIDQQRLQRHMCAPPDGGEVVSRICQAQRKSYDMCIARPFTKQELCREAEKMVTSGLDYIQILDQNHGGTPYFCYSDRHGHPPVPGGWMVNHMTAFLKRLKAVVGNDVLLGCESAAAEAYLPYLSLSDNRFNLNYGVGRPVPLYGYLYHEYLCNFSGNSVSSNDVLDRHRSPHVYLHRLAHSCLAGDLLTLVIDQDGHIMWSWGDRDHEDLPDEKAILDFVRVVTAYRRGCGKPYLVYGRMVRPCPVESEEVPLHRPWGTNGVPYPAVMSTAFRASDGTTAQFLATYRTVEETCTVDLTSTGGADLIDEQGIVLATLPADKVTLALPPHCIRMLKWR